MLIMARWSSDISLRKINKKKLWQIARPTETKSMKCRQTHTTLSFIQKEAAEMS
jgi:hypothetical protein